MCFGVISQRLLQFRIYLSISTAVYYSFTLFTAMLMLVGIRDARGLRCEWEGGGQPHRGDRPPRVGIPGRHRTATVSGLRPEYARDRRCARV